MNVLDDVVVDCDCRPERVASDSCWS